MNPEDATATVLTTVARSGLLEGLPTAGFSMAEPLLLRQVVSGGILMGKDHPHHRSIRPVVLVELIPRHHHRRLPGRFRHGCTPHTRSRRNARSLRLSASIRRHSSAAAPCSIRRRRQPEGNRPQRCSGYRPPAPLSLPRLPYPNIPRVGAGRLPSRLPNYLVAGRRRFSNAGTCLSTRPASWV